MSQAPLAREEYIEQTYFFRTFAERLEEGVPSQEILEQISDEVLATTKLPMALSFLRGEIIHNGTMSTGMKMLPHYFTPFQSYVLSKAEEDRSKFDQTIALQILEAEAKYRTEEPTQPGLFIYQFESLARNRLGYELGLKAVAEDPFYEERWRNWIQVLPRLLATVDLTDLLYQCSAYYVEDCNRQGREVDESRTGAILFGAQEGKIAKANRGKEPLYFFSALQRQLGYPAVPRPQPKSNQPIIHPALEFRLQKLEVRLKLLESENKGSLDLSQFSKQFADLDQQIPPSPPSDL